MTRIQKISFLLLAFVTMIGLSACGAPDNSNTQVDKTETVQKTSDTGKYLEGVVKNLPDGRTVTCVIYHQGYAGGLSCDWTNAK